MATPEEAAAEILLRQSAQESLLSFTEYTHPKWDSEDHHAKICYRLEQLERREVCKDCGQVIDKLATFAPPRSGKTELSLRRFAAWCMGRNPGWHVISAMANGELARDTGGEVRDIVNSAEYKRIFPGVTLKKDAAAAGRWIVERVLEERAKVVRGVYFCGGVDGSFPGRGANLLDIDDPHKSAQEADSQRMRDLAAKFYFGDAVQRLEHPSIQLLTNTRRHEDDLAGRILGKTDRLWEATDDPQFLCVPEKGWHVLRLRGIEHEGTAQEVGLRTRGCAPNADPMSHMGQMKRLYEGSGQMRYWYSEFQQEPRPEEGTYCKDEYYKNRYDEVPEGLWIYATSDFAVTDEKSESKDPDWTCHCIFGLSNVETEEVEDANGKKKDMVTADEMFVLDWWSGRTTPDVWISEWCRLVKQWRPYAWFGTKGVIRNAIEMYLLREQAKERAWCRLEWLSDVRSKTAKGRPFQGMSASGRIRFPRTDWADEVIGNVVGFPHLTHDDEFDTMANAGRSMVEVPEAFSGAPKQDETPVEEESDIYEYADGGFGDTQIWKGM